MFYLFRDAKVRKKSELTKSIQTFNTFLTLGNIGFEQVLFFHVDENQLFTCSR